MFGFARLKQLFRTSPLKRDYSVRFVDAACHASNSVVISGSFIYLVQDSTIQVARLLELFLLLLTDAIHTASHV